MRLNPYPLKNLEGPEPLLDIQRKEPDQYNFEFFLDGTGASNPIIPGGIGVALPGASNLLPKQETVKEKVKKFLEVTYDDSKDIHRQRYLKILWGNAFAKGPLSCILVSANISYTLFRPDGEPLRAKIQATFYKSISQLINLRENKPSSPDLTHIREVEEGDTLPLKSHRIYKDPKYYIQLAQFNRLKNFRRLRTGQQLSFPPLQNENP